MNRVTVLALLAIAFAAAVVQQLAEVTAPPHLAIIERTGCGMLTFQEEPVRKLIAERTGADTAARRLSPFRDQAAA